MSLDRRRFLQTGILGTASVVTGRSLMGVEQQASSPRDHVDSTHRITPAEIEGPFYPILAQKDQDFDLTVIEGHQIAAIGEVIIVQGRVCDEQGQSISDATVDIWQANAAGVTAIHTIKIQHP